MLVTRNVRAKYMAPQGEDGGEGGGGTATIAAALAATAAAEKASADKVVSDKAAADAFVAQAAADLAAGKKPGVSDTEAALLKENMQKKAQLQKSADEKAALEAKLKSFEGIDVDAVRKSMADQKIAEEKALVAAGDFDRLKTRMADEHGKEIKALKDQLEDSNGKLSKLGVTINDLTVGTQFSQSKFISEELTLPPSKARLLYSDHFDLEDGKVVGYDKPRGQTARTALVDGSGNAVGFEAAMRSIVEADPEKDHLMKSKVKPGASSDSKKGVPAAKSNDAFSSGINKISASLASIVKG